MKEFTRKTNPLSNTTECPLKRSEKPWWMVLKIPSSIEGINLGIRSRPVNSSIWLSSRREAHKSRPLCPTARLWKDWASTCHYNHFLELSLGIWYILNKYLLNKWNKKNKNMKMMCSCKPWDRLKSWGSKWFRSQAGRDRKGNRTLAGRGVRDQSEQESDLKVKERKWMTEAAAGSTWKHLSCARHGIKCSTWRVTG